MSGPGTEFKRIAERYGFPACEACNQLAEAMDRNGPQWCRDHIDLLLLRIEENARQMGVPFVRWYVESELRRAIEQSQG